MYNLIFLLSVISAPAVVLPPDPELIDKPDTIITYEKNQLYGTFVMKYNSDSYTVECNYNGKLDPYFYESYTGNYLRNGDTIVGSYSDTTADKYVLNQKGLVIKNLTYSKNILQEIDSITYNTQNKMIKVIMNKVVPNDSVGDSTIFTYDQNSHLKSSKTYGDAGTVWEYIEFEYDSKNRVSKAIYYDCTSSCTITNSYDLYHYSSSAVRRNIATVNGNLYKMEVSPEMINLTFYNGCTLNYLNIYDLSGNKVPIDANLKKNGGKIRVNKCLGQMYILHMNTSKGLISSKISVPDNQ